jgi:hypothetical protein
MSAGATLLANTAERALRWSSTGHVDPRPETCPALLAPRHSSQTDLVTGAPAKPIGPASQYNQPIAAPPLIATDPTTAVKSP